MEDMKNKERKENNNKKVNQYRYDYGVIRHHIHYIIKKRIKGCSRILLMRRKS